MGQARPPLAVDTGPGCELPAGRLHHRPQGFNPWLWIGRIDHIGQIDSTEVINASGQRSRNRLKGPKVGGSLEMDLRRQQRFGFGEIATAYQESMRKLRLAAAEGHRKTVER